MIPASRETTVTDYKDQTLQLTPAAVAPCPPGASRCSHCYFSLQAERTLAAVPDTRWPLTLVLCTAASCIVHRHPAFTAYLSAASRAVTVYCDSVLPRGSDNCDDASASNQCTIHNHQEKIKLLKTYRQELYKTLCHLHFNPLPLSLRSVTWIYQTVTDKYSRTLLNHTYKPEIASSLPSVLHGGAGEGAKHHGTPSLAMAQCSSASSRGDETAVGPHHDT